MLNLKLIHNSVRQFAPLKQILTQGELKKYMASK